MQQRRGEGLLVFVEVAEPYRFLLTTVSACDSKIIAEACSRHSLKKITGVGGLFFSPVDDFLHCAPRLRIRFLAHISLPIKL